MDKTNIISTVVLVLGAGVIGLAVAKELSKKHELILVEQYPQFGRETSSRNSEVVHSGIYYPKESLKTKMCIEGRKLLYDFCEQKNIPYKKCGKFVVATCEEDEAYLDKLYAHSRDLEVKVERVEKSKTEKSEPLIKVKSALYFPDTGIVDSHVLMQRLEEGIYENKAAIAYRHKVKTISKNAQWTTLLESPDGELIIESRRIINCSGLFAAELSNQVLKTKKYEHRYCRGRYFALSQKFQNKFQHLIYPVPPKDGLGVHVTIDNSGFARLGPDVDWCLGKNYSEVNSLYDCDWDSLQTPFVEAAKKYLPDLQMNEVSPSLIGIRPKLFIDGVAHPDFLIEDHDGYMHCLGIESPGLTASLSIASSIGTAFLS